MNVIEMLSMVMVSASWINYIIPPKSTPTTNSGVEMETIIPNPIFKGKLINIIQHDFDCEYSMHYTTLINRGLVVDSIISRIGDKDYPVITILTNGLLIDYHASDIFEDDSGELNVEYNDSLGLHHGWI